MKFYGGTCENIHGELLNYEIIEHENNRTIECRVERARQRDYHWLVRTLIVTYTIALLGIYKKVKKEK
jgi:hypothetical protein